MCSWCVDGGAELWQGDASARAAAGAAAEVDMVESDDAAIDAALHAVASRAEAETASAALQQAAAGGRDASKDPTATAPPPPAAVPPRTKPRLPPPPPMPRAQPPGAVPPPQRPKLAAAPPQPPPPFISHNDERLELGKPLWLEVASRIPRPGHDGSLHMPGSRLASVDLAAVRDQFPQLPIVEPAPAEVRARAALRAGANDGAWTPKLKATARSCFEAEAANIKTIVCIPEVVARDELLADPTFQVGPYPSPFHPSALSPAAGPSRPSQPEPPQ